MKRLDQFHAKMVLASAVASIPFLWASQASAYSTTTEPFSGVTLTHSTQNAPNSANFYLLSIDLNNPNISFEVTPKNTAPNSKGIPDKQTTTSFVNSTGAQIGINANLFSGVSANWPNGSISGVAASQGNVYGAFDSYRPSVNISADKTVTFLPTLPANFTLYNTISGSDHIVTNGLNTTTPSKTPAGTSGAPRTSIGITADNKLLLFVADGYNTNGYPGLTPSQEADILIAYGAVNALNLDGGGSSTMVLRASSSAQIINHPSDGTARSVGVNFGVFAAPATQQQNLMVYNDFYGGDQGTFHYSPTTSGSTKGVLNTSTNVAVQGSDAVARGWYDRLTINDDPNVSSVSDHPGSGWFVRMISGANASQSENIARPTTGYIGYWARTTTPGVLATIALDDANNVTADRGILQSMIADGQWHLYQWNLEDNSQWTGWVNGDGQIIPNSTFTIDSLQFFGPNANAVIDVDMISHNALGALVPEPSGAAMMMLAACPLLLLRRRKNSSNAA
jgi:hypothetical protein